MSVEDSGPDLALLERVRDSRYGWGWMDDSSIRSVQPAIMPNRPATTDLGNPFVIVKDAFRAMKMARLNRTSRAQHVLGLAEEVIETTAPSILADHARFHVRDYRATDFDYLSD